MGYLVLLLLVHLCVRFPLVLEAGVPTYAKVSRYRTSTTRSNYLPNAVGPLDGTNLPCTRLSATSHELDQGITYIRSTLEHDWLMTRPFGICERADGLGGFVFKPIQHLVHVLRA